MARSRSHLHLALAALLVGSIGTVAVAKKGDLLYDVRNPDFQTDLFLLSAKTGQSTKLNPILNPDGSESVNQSFAFGPKGKVVFYVADQDVDGTRELYRADLKSGTVTKLNGTLVAGSQINNVRVAD